MMDRPFLDSTSERKLEKMQRVRSSKLPAPELGNKHPELEF